MRAICVCMEQFESRTLLSAGAVDPSYAGAYNNSSLPQLYGEQVHAQLDGKMIHYAFSGASNSTQLWRTNPNGALDTTFGTSGAINLGDFKVNQFAAQPDGKLVVLLRQDANNSISLR